MQGSWHPGQAKVKTIFHLCFCHQHRKKHPFRQAAHGCKASLTTPMQHCSDLLQQTRRKTLPLLSCSEPDNSFVRSSDFTASHNCMIKKLSIATWVTCLKDYHCFKISIPNALRLDLEMPHIHPAAVLAAMNLIVSTRKAEHENTFATRRYGKYKLCLANIKCLLVSDASDKDGYLLQLTVAPFRLSTCQWTTHTHTCLLGCWWCCGLDVVRIQDIAHVKLATKNNLHTLCICHPFRWIKSEWPQELSTSKWYMLRWLMSLMLWLLNPSTNKYTFELKCTCWKSLEIFSSGMSVASKTVRPRRIRLW